MSDESNQGRKRAHSPGDSLDGDPGRESSQPEGWHRTLGTSSARRAPPVLLMAMPLEDSDPMEMSRYVGQNSIPALLRDQPSTIEPKDGVDIRRDMRPIFGLENSAPFPLMSSRHLERITQDIFSELPSDREVMK